MKIDLGCGKSKRGEDYIGVDIVKLEGVDVVHDLNTFPWPFENESVDEIHTSHYVEHVPYDVNGDGRDGLIQFMDECYRILKPGGKLIIQVPYGSSIRAFQDPTHRRFLFKESFYYFNKEWRDTMNLEYYPINSNYIMEFSYFITNEMSLKSQEVRDLAILHEWNVVDDLKVELTKI